MKTVLRNLFQLRIAGGMLVGLLTLVQTVHAQRDEKADRERKIRPIVVMQQSEISGRVFVLQSEQSKETPKGKTGTDVKIELRTSDQDGVVHRTITDKDGRFVLPNLDVGDYRLRVGRLWVDLRVEAPPAPGSTEAAKQVSKTIVLFIPEELVD